MADQRPRTYQRFTRTERVEHLVLMLSFIVLALTGLPQKYVGNRWAEGLIAAMGGIEMVRQMHHIAAVVLMLEVIFHIVAAGYRFFVLRRPASILPQFKDVKDWLGDIRYNLGLSQQRPQMDRYTYVEKIEYWAVVWGTLIMAITGFMMWNPITTTRFLPGDFIPAAKAAHGGEAILAVLSILTWHVYHVHLKRFNKSMFTGKVTEEEMRHEHPLELTRIESGRMPAPPDVETRARRERVYLPVATALAALLLFGLYEFVTYEQTAITTLPRRATVVAFVPATPTPTPTSTPTPRTSPTPPATPAPAAARAGLAAAIPHPLEGRENCLLCHGINDTIRPMPADHAGRSNASCLNCHQEQSAVTPTATVSASVSFQRDLLPLFEAKCQACHGTLGGLSLTSYEAVMRGGNSGSAVVAGQPEQSLLVKKQQGEHPGKFTDDELAMVIAWIRAGAPDN